LAPLFILWFGLGITAKIVLIALIVFFLVYLNTVTGVKEVDEDLIDTMRIMGANGTTIFTQVIIPNAGLWILTALKQAIPKAITGTIAAEMIAAKAGMGYLILKASSMLDIGGVFAALLVLLIVGLLLTGLVGWIEKYLLRWKTTS
jgi:NitT/TauT family transport system permease protein